MLTSDQISEFNTRDAEASSSSSRCRFAEPTINQRKSSGKHNDIMNE